MAREYTKTDTMRIKISGNPFGDSEELTGLDLINQGGQKTGDEPDAPTAQFEYNQNFDELLETLYDAVVITDTKGSIVKFNSRAQEYFGYRPDEFKTLGIQNIIPGADDEKLEQFLSVVSSDRRLFVDGYCVTKNTSMFPAEITVGLLHLRGHEELCFFVRDISVRAKAEEDLRKAQQELVETAHHAGMAEIATGVLHDVGNILNSINVSCELILKVMDESALDALIKVNEQVKQLDPAKIGDFITNDPRGQKLLAIYRELGEALTKERDGAKTEANHLRSKIMLVKEVISRQQTYATAGLFVEEAQLETLVEDALAILKSTVERDDLVIHKEYEHVPPVRVQKSKFIHVALNIIKNATEALANVTDRQREITLRLRQEGAFATVSVIDNGEGIPREVMDQMFTHGFTTKQSGHGFGLHSCANLLTEMGGKIQVMSDGAGQGATFILTIPLAPQE